MYLLDNKVDPSTLLWNIFIDCAWEAAALDKKEMELVGVYMK